jgi:cytochrome P460
VTMDAYRVGVPANGKPYPDGSKMAKIERKPKKSPTAPYDIRVPGTVYDVDFMVKDSKRFGDSGGWGYAVFKYDAVHEQRHHLEPVQPPRQIFVQPLPSPPHHGSTDRTLATASAGPPARPRLQTALVVARRHSGKELLHHPGGQGISIAKGRHRGQRRFPADRLPHARAAHLHAPTPEGELRRCRPPVMMGALRLMPALGPGQGDGLGAKQLVQRRQPVRMDPGEQVVARGRHPRQHRADEGAQFHAHPLLLLRSLVSLCSLGHRRLLGPRRGDCCLGRRDSHADLGAVATQFSNSTEAGTSPECPSPEIGGGSGPG